jgi:hypothetical protein
LPVKIAWFVFGHRIISLPITQLRTSTAALSRRTYAK